MKGTVWTDDCRSWCEPSHLIHHSLRTHQITDKDPNTNRVNAVWSVDIRSTTFPIHQNPFLTCYFHRPGASLHYIETIRQPRYEDFNFQYSSVSSKTLVVSHVGLSCYGRTNETTLQKNMWRYLGNGFTRAATREDGDKSPYLSVDAIDADWLCA
jgi:hypothetical protein